jgi:hypothetical protein
VQRIVVVVMPVVLVAVVVPAVLEVGADVVIRGQRLSGRRRQGARDLHTTEAAVAENSTLATSRGRGPREVGDAKSAMPSSSDGRSTDTCVPNSSPPSRISDDGHQGRQQRAG